MIPIRLMAIDPACVVGPLKAQADVKWCKPPIPATNPTRHRRCSPTNLSNSQRTDARIAKLPMHRKRLLLRTQCSPRTSRWHSTMGIGGRISQAPKWAKPPNLDARGSGEDRTKAQAETTHQNSGKPEILKSPRILSRVGTVLTELD
jgi:hypothetical protein